MADKAGMYMDINDEDLINDEDMKRLLAVLDEIPEVPLPDTFNERLHNAFKTEGHKIRKERHNNGHKGNKWRIKTIAAFAACFLVVFASVSVYNNHWDLPKATDNDNMESIMEANEDINDKESKIDDIPLQASEDSALGFSAYGDYKDEIKKDVIVKNDIVAQKGRKSIETDKMKGSETSTDNSLIQREEEGSLLDAERGYSTANDESSIYFEKIEKWFSGYEYDIVSTEKKENAEVYEFTIHITKDSKGKKIDEYVKLTGELGEIYEPEAKKPEASGN